MTDSRLLIATALILGCAATAPAQPSASARLSLDDAVSAARAESHRAAELRARQTAAAAAVDLRAAAGKPSVSALAGYTRTNHVDEFGVPQPDGRLRVIYPDIPDNYRARIDLQWPIYTGGRVDALTRAARAERDAFDADLDTLHADLSLEVTRAYWAAVTAAASVRVLEQAVARAEAHLADMKARDGVGLVSPHEVAAVEAQRSRQRMLLVEAESLRASSEVALARLTGLPLDTTFTLTEPLERGRPGGDASAEPDRPERVALVGRLSAADARQAAAAAGRRPVVSVVGGVDYANPNPRLFPRQDAWKPSWDVTVQASWSLWDAGRVRAETAQAAAVAAAERARLAEFDSLVAAEARQRRLELDSAYAAVGAAADALASADEALRVAGHRFDAGVATSTDVLDAQVARLQAELDRTRALANVRLAEARLARALGR